MQITPSGTPKGEVESLNAAPAVKRRAERHAAQADANGWAAEVLGAREDQKGDGRHRVASSGFALQWGRGREPRDRAPGRRRRRSSSLLAAHSRATSALTASAHGGIASVAHTVGS